MIMKMIDDYDDDSSRCWYMIWYDMIMMDVDAGDDAWMLETYRLQM